MSTSEASLTKFDPRVIPYQKDVVRLLRNEWDYEEGFVEVLLSGSIGSAKSTLAAHMAITHCLLYPGARVALCRRALPDIKRTIYLKCLEHISNELAEGDDYWINSTNASITFKNGSEVISISWADKRYMRSRSIDLSAAVFEEIIENDGDDVQGYEEVKMRIGRLPKVKEKWIISCTNPGPPSSYWYKYFIENEKHSRRVFYSITTDNPFLPEVYINQLKENLDPKEAERMLYGKWTELAREVVYHAYDKNKNYRPYAHEINRFAPIHITWDFNIAVGKPLSLCLFQFIKKQMHIFAEVIIEGADTEEACQEIAGRGFLDHEDMKYFIHGDATARARSTKNKSSDYDIIGKFLANYRTPKGVKIDFEVEVPLENPPIRTRHNLVNAYCHNALNQINLFVYKDAPTVDEGLRLTSLKKGGSYIEDDSKRFQHVTTALGYGLWWLHREIRDKPAMTRSQIR